MKIQSIIIGLAALAAHASAMAIRDETGALLARVPDGDFDAINDALEKRNSYACGAHIYGQSNCNGNVLFDRNHDAKSCNANTNNGAPNPPWLSYRDKTDGTQHGICCLTTFTDDRCTVGGASYYLNGDGACGNLSGGVE
jgi:hypothetical protein